MKSANTQKCANSSNQQTAADIIDLAHAITTIIELQDANSRLRAELLAARAEATALRRDVEILRRKANRARRHPWGPQVPP